MTHGELVERARLWLLTFHQCQRVLRGSEIGVRCAERPDVIGWTKYGGSILVEAKVSRSDFKRDVLKACRQGGGLGLYRYYLTTWNLVRADEVPDGYGLAHCWNRKIEILVPAAMFTARDLDAEIVLLANGRESNETRVHRDAERDDAGTEASSVAGVGRTATH